MGERVAFNLFPIIRVLVPLVGPDTIVKRLTTVLTTLAALMVFANLPATLIDVNATTALMDLIAIIAAFKLRNRQKVSRKLIVGLFCMVFLVKFGIVVMLIAVNGHVLTEHWILMPYNSRALVSFIELICNNLSFLYHFIMSLVLLQPVVFPRIFDKKVIKIF